MKLEIGKQYVMRNGEVVGPLADYGGGDFRFTARANDGQKLSWRIDGSERIDRGESCHDIVSEASEPLRWVECKPDKPGIWARRGAAGEIVNVDVVRDITLPWVSDAARCYLGPIPEILPPVKKVVQRLCMKLVTDVKPECGSLYEGRWITEGTIMPVDWIRTDETREVEQ